MTLEQRMEIERKVVLFLLQTMRSHGWEPYRINDGGEPDEDIRPTNDDEAMDAVFAVDEARIYFRKPSDTEKFMYRSAYIVLGNDGWDAIADHSVSSARFDDDFEKIMDLLVMTYCEDLETEARGV